MDDIQDVSALTVGVKWPFSAGRGVAQSLQPLPQLLGYEPVWAPWIISLAPPQA